VAQEAPQRGARAGSGRSGIHGAPLARQSATHTLNWVRGSLSSLGQNDRIQCSRSRSRSPCAQSLECSAAAARRAYRRGFILVWVAFPILNAATDFASWIVSRALARHLLNTLRRPEDRGFGTAFLLAAHLAVDMAIAMVLFFFTAWCVLQGFTLWNAYLAWLGLDSGRLVPDMRAIARAPLSDGLWFWLMIATTLVPTVAHAHGGAHRLRPREPAGSSALAVQRLAARDRRPTARPRRP
jgi:hypothetical protein